MDAVEAADPLVEQLTPPLQEALSDSGEHELTLRKQRVCQRRAAVAASKRRHSKRLAAKEPPQYVDAETKATRLKAAKLDLTGISNELASALADSGVLEHPPPSC